MGKHCLALIFFGGTRMIHVILNDRTTDLTMEEVGLQDGMNDNQVIGAVAQSMNLPANTFSGYRVYTNLDTGDMTVGPTAKYGL
jgi:hypothetical protein